MIQSMDMTALDEDTLGGRIFKARDMCGMTIEDAAARLGVTLDTFTEWENDRSEPRANKLMMLAGVLSVTPAWLISGAGEGPDQSIVSAGLAELSGELDRLVDLNNEVTNGIAALRDRIDTLLRASSN
ncbi:helix-turn-helix domain-containing protein [Pseudohoeflea suaedae]|uniref:Helix-turn-helix domain-containing protein n=1 Tax=Pseudohoeflea suaedae TaxID=877384 RepID=A0A4R5PKA8_9HYPH|nr:helix-turn-helix domain-containing protein [Pseudohoeflea suaedae]TDH36151.1 helix-turn-helix domain-containing protein [Pseudohoeflea suaedae]